MRFGQHPHSSWGMVFSLNTPFLMVGILTTLMFLPNWWDSLTGTWKTLKGAFLVFCFWSPLFRETRMRWDFWVFWLKKKTNSNKNQRSTLFHNYQPVPPWLFSLTCLPVSLSAPPLALLYGDRRKECLCIRKATVLGGPAAAVEICSF